MAAEKNEEYDLVVIGAGPGGYVAAIRGAQLGLRVVCVERRETLGGTCLNVGCIPSKALLESTWKFHECRHAMKAHGINIPDVAFDLKAMMGRKEKIVTSLARGLEYLFKKNKITRIDGMAQLQEGLRVRIRGENEQTVLGKAILLATGSKAGEIPGVQFNGTTVISSTEALALTEVPGHLAVIGAGAIGLELGSVWHRLGAEVTVVEYFDRILPSVDGSIAAHGLRSFKKQGIKFILDARITGVEEKKDGCVIAIEGQKPLLADKILLAAGRKPCLDDLGFLELGGSVDKNGFIEVDSTWQTSLKNIYAIGDVTGGAMLAHKASDEGIACVEQIVQGYGHVNYHAIPGIVYTHPEIGSVGQTEEQLREQGVPVVVGESSFKANGRALAMNEVEGLVKIIAHKETDKILGAHIIGPRAGDLLAEMVAAMNFGATSEDLAMTCHAHPTLSEALREAALAITTGAIHG
ncbi:MAG: dihydrolipoyl dehydrogenase [Desulforhopalus sp.]